MIRWAHCFLLSLFLLSQPVWPANGASTQMIIPLVFGDADHATGIGVSNFGGKPAALVFELYSPTGQQIGSSITWNADSPVGKPGLLEPGEQRAFDDTEIFGLQPGQERTGWVLIKSDNPDVRAVYQFFSGRLDRLDGMNAVREPARELLFAWILHGPEAFRGYPAETRIAIVNPGDTGLPVVLTLVTSSGETIGTIERTVASKAMLQGAISELFPGFSGTNAVLFARAGGNADQGMVGCELLTIQGADSPAFVAANGQPIADYSGALYSAQAALLGGLRTNVRIANPGESALSAILRVRRDDGSLQGSAREVTVPPKGFLHLDLGHDLSLPDQTVGTLEVAPGGPGLLGSVLFGDPEVGYAAALPLQRLGTQELVFPHVAFLKPSSGHAGIFTGIAIHAPGSVDVEGRIDVLDKNGVPTASSPFSLPAGGRLSRQVSELVTMEEQAGGSVRIQAYGQPLVAQEMFGDNSLRMLSAVPAFEGSGFDPLAVPESKYIVVDQFGYLPTSEKIAVIRDPITGFDADESFAPGPSYALVNAHNGRHLLSGPPSAWNGGVEDSSSGDRAWWFDFSAVTAEGEYYVLDIEKNVRSPQFRIAPNVYREVLRHAVRAFFYQRAGSAKEARFAGQGWADGPSHVGPLQDRNCRLFSNPLDASTERDLSGGWYDAGDFNKYTNWSAEYVIELLRAYEQAPSAFTDDFGIPESGNGIADLLDEAKWGMDWLVRMQNPDGSVLSIIGESHASPPSSASGPSLYGPANTSATLSTAAAFAYGAKVFGALGKPELQAYAAGLLPKAEKAWQWALANPRVLFRNNDAAYSNTLGAGQQEVDDYGRFVKKLEAAAFLFEVTGRSEFREFFESNYAQVHMFVWSGFVFPFAAREQETVLYYASLPGATPSVASHIRQVYAGGMNSEHNLQAILGERDPYLAYMKDYTWGSNSVKCRQAGMYLNLDDYDAAPAQTDNAWRAAARYIHYIHGVNPLGIVYLSNMYGAGAENSANEFYHTWFCNGSPLWDRVGTSTYGPPPGFLTGGPNPDYNWDGCCPSGCGSPSNNAKCYAEQITPPKGQPKQKAYKDFNTSWPLNSWSVTENSNGYQAAYIRLLSRFVAGR